MKVAFFHGLESSHQSEKSKFLLENFDSAFCPEMKYSDPSLFERILQEVKERKSDLLIGSSMGGWFAYCLSTLTKIPTLLFNPAFHSRSMKTFVDEGSLKSNHVVILGKSDDIIDPKISREWIAFNGKGKFEIHEENIGHRTPIEVFKKWVIFLSKNRRLTESFDRWCFEEWSTEAPLGTNWSFLPEEVIQTMIPNFLSKHPAIGGRLTVENEEEMKECMKIVSNSSESFEFLRRSSKEPHLLFTESLPFVNEQMSDECLSLWNLKENNKIVSIIKEEIRRPRPYWINPKIRVSKDLREDLSFSFPSGHATNARYVALSLSEKFPSLRNSLIELSNRIGRSRIELGVHFPSDVEAGFRLGDRLYEMKKKSI